ncbi:MAG: extracellular solute-binding protein [Clostridia bacterium]|nr:extracellular solute-binding protein [Clostridia bacterium]
MKKLTALALALMMLLSMAGIATAEAPRHIVIGTTWDIFYDSTHLSVEDNPGYSGDISQDMMFAKVKEVEEEWNVTFEFMNMTYSGSKESINTSILAGTPDADVYMVGMAVAAPAIANGLAVDLKDVLPADHPVITGTDEVLSYVDVGNGGVSLLIANKKENMVADTNPLGFNLQMIEDANLEDPRDLVERGEWTWDKFIEYCQVLTKDKDGDGIIDVYGFGGWPEDYLNELLMSNGTYIAANTTENLTSPEVGEVLQFMQDMNVTYGIMHPIPEVNGWDVCRFLYREQKVAFSPLAAWIMDSNSDYAYKHPELTPLEFDMVFVPWPVGPSGNAETNAGKAIGSTGYMIPVGVEDPEFVFNVLYDILNWYNYDPNNPQSDDEALDIRDNEEALGWWYGVVAKDVDLQDYNFNVMYEMGLKTQFDMINNLGVSLEITALVNGDYTVAQYQEMFKQPIQDAITAIMGE